MAFHPKSPQVEAYLSIRNGAHLDVEGFVKQVEDIDAAIGEVLDLVVAMQNERNRRKALAYDEEKRRRNA